MTWLLRLLPYAAAAFFGGLVMHKTVDHAELAGVQSDFAVFRAQTATDREIAAETAARALIAQAEQQTADEAHNAQVLHDLKTANADADARHTADRAFIRSLLGSTCASPAPAAGGDTVPAVGAELGAPGASGTGGAPAVAGIELCIDTKAEDERNANRLDALIAELAPKLKRPSP